MVPACHNCCLQAIQILRSNAIAGSTNGATTRTITTNTGGGVATLTNTTTRNGATSTTIWTAATGTLTNTSPAGRSTVATLNANDDVIAYQRGTLTPITFAYDTRGRMTRITHGTLRSDLTYDSRDRLTTTTDALGHTRTYAYDTNDRTISTTLPSGRTFTVQRDTNGNVNSVELPGPDAPHHTLLNDPLDRLSSYTAPGRNALQMTYTPDREPATTTLPSSATIVSAYDTGGRPTTTTFPEAVATQTYTDTTNRVATATRTPTSGTTQTSTYTHTGDLLSRDNETGNTIADLRYTYTNDLDLATWSLDLASSIITRDADRLVTADGPWTHTINTNSDTTNITNASDPTDTVTINYDTLGRVTTRTVTVNGTTVHTLAITYDNAGRIATRTDTTDTPATRTYNYDTDNRLTTVTGTETSTYTYDARDNLTSSPAGPTTYTTNDQVATNVYDTNGRLAARGPDTYTYSTRGELLAATVAATPVTYTYDAAARRTTRTTNGITTQYIYGNLDDPIELTATKQGAITTIYRYDTQHNLAAIERSGTRYLVATDPVGSPTLIVDTTNPTTIVLQRTYDAYGRLTTTTGTLDLPIGYAGGITDPTTHLDHYGQRDYDPTTARFTAPDPTLYTGGQFNLYTYLNANPTNTTDRTGLDGRQTLHQMVDEFSNFMDESSRKLDNAIDAAKKACGFGPPPKSPPLPPPPRWKKLRTPAQQQAWDEEVG